MKNLKLTVAYEGTDFLGWQKTKMGPSIQEALEAAAETILQEKTSFQAASRTDAGVHARAQVVNFFSGKEILDLRRFHISLNSLLPKSIAVIDCIEAPIDFHPTLDARQKEYRYYLCNSIAQHPEYRHFSWHCPHKLDLAAMKSAAECFAGRHDFAAFCNVKKNEEYEDTVRTLSKVEIVELPAGRLCIHLLGNRFLYKMARNIVGTLIHVGRGKIDASSIETILAGKKRCAAGMTAPALGLTLHEITYSS